MIYPDFDELVTIGTKANRLELASRRPMFAAASGNYVSPFRGQGLSFHEVREYRHGDDIRNIDWRVTARMNKPHMKVFTEDRERTVMLCTDANATMRFGTRGTFKSIQAARAAAFVGRLANGSHDRLGCLLYGDVPEGLQYFRPSRSRRALWQALQLLSRKETGAHKARVTLTTALQRLDRVAPTGSLNFVISDFHAMPKDFEQTARHLRLRCDLVFIRVSDPADGLIPPVGTAWFSDDDGLRAPINTNSKEGQKAYTEEWYRLRLETESICARNAIGLIDIHTDREIEQDLVPALRRLSAGGKR